MISCLKFQNALQISLSHNPKENSLESDELAAFGVGTLAQNQKTMKFKEDFGNTDRSMGLVGSPSEMTEPDDIITTASANPYDLTQTQSQRGSDGSGISRQSHQSRASGMSNTQSRASVGSLKGPRFYDYHSNQSRRVCFAL